MANRLYVGNLPFEVTTEVLRAAFAAHGEVTDVHLVTDRQTGDSRGFGFVTMGSAAEAATAISAMDGAELSGRRLRVNEAQERTGGGGGGGGGGRGGGGGGGGPRRGGGGGNDRRQRW
jgi:RNA recognition motif-containing protein